MSQRAVKPNTTNQNLNIAEETVPKTSTKSKKAKKPLFTDDCKTAIENRKGALRQFNNRPTHDNLNNYRIFRAKAPRTIKDIWETGNVPKSWKEATIIPIPKPGWLVVLGLTAL